MSQPSSPESPLSPRRSVWRISQIYWFCLAYMGGWTIWRWFVPDHRLSRFDLIGFALVLMAASVVLALRSRLAAARGGYGMGYSAPVHFLLPIVHFALIIAGIRLTGGLNSPFWSIIFVALVAETVLAPPHESRLMRWGAGFALLIATFPIPYQNEWLSEFLSRLLFLLVMSLAAGRLRRVASQREEELFALRTEMAALQERAYLSREVHDQVGNTLAAAVLRLDVSARVLLKRQWDEAAQILSEEASGLRQAMNRIRDWTFLTRPWLADETEKPSVILQREAIRLTKRCELPVEVIDAELLDDLPPPVRLAALRITQEALTNIVKHALGATKATICAQADDQSGNIVLTIQDDGPGFAQQNGEGIGLTAMRERARGVGGDLTVESETDVGTRITATFSID